MCSSKIGAKVQWGTMSFNVGIDKLFRFSQAF